MADFCTQKFDQGKIKIIYVSDGEVQTTKDIFQERYTKYQKNIPGTRGMYHHFYPQGDKIYCYMVSDSPFPFEFDFRIDQTPLISPEDLVLFTSLLTKTSYRLGCWLNMRMARSNFKLCT